MVDQRKHRGPDPSDERLFGPEGQATLRLAVADTSWLLSRGYSEEACITLVGDRYRLRRRQRVALRRMACSDRDLERRKQKMQRLGAGVTALAIDGFNILVTVESALGGAVVLRGRDGCFRDLAGLRGTYRIVAETGPALDLIGSVLAKGGVQTARWILDRPVSNSGRLAGRLRALAMERGWDWEVILEDDADNAILHAGLPVATADSALLDRCDAWIDLGSETINRSVPQAWIVGD